jgi:hypothetical protein
MARLLLVLGCLAVWSASISTAEAQRRVPNYRSRPVISPYANLFRADNAGLNSYFSVVRPQQMVLQSMRDTNYDIALQQQLIDQRTQLFQQELQQSLQGGTTGALQVRPTTGTAATALRRPAGSFMNYSTYFPMGTSVPNPQLRVRR